MLTIEGATSDSFSLKYLIGLIIFLVKYYSLRVNKGPRSVEVQGSFEVVRNKFRCIFNSPNSAVNQILLRVGAIRDPTSLALEKA
jgi:hypothetical protein